MQKCFLVIFIGLLIIVAPEYAHPSVNNLPWYEKFTAEEALDGDREDFGFMCREWLAPQWETAEDIESALAQMEALMDQIGAKYLRQIDIATGYIAYYFSNTSPIEMGPTIPNVGDLMSASNPALGDFPELQSNASDYFEKYGLHYHMRAINGFVSWGSTAVEEGEVARFMFPVLNLSTLETLSETSELTFPPEFILVAIKNRKKQLEQSGRQYGDKWEFLYSERRDAFEYHYVFPLNPPEVSTAPFPPKYGAIVFRLDAKRTQDGALKDVELRELFCHLDRGRGSKYPAPDVPDIDGNVKPRPPVLIPECPEYRRWYHCYGGNRAAPDPLIKRSSCSNFTPEPPVCVQ